MTNSTEQFETIVSNHYESLYRFAMSLTRSESDALDLTQQTFYVWARKGHQLRDASKIKTWMFSTLYHAFLAGRRKHTRFPHCELDEVINELEAPASRSTNHADTIQVLLALAQVDEIYQAAVALFYLEDCSYNEIASKLEIPIGTVKSRIARGIMQLRKILISEESGKLCQHEDSFDKNTRPATNRSEPDRSEWDLSPALVAEPFDSP